MDRRLSLKKVQFLSVFLYGSVGDSPSWSRHRILIPTFGGSNPSSPTKQWLGDIKVIMLDCLSGHRGSIPLRVAKMYGDMAERLKAAVC